MTIGEMNISISDARIGQSAVVIGNQHVVEEYIWLQLLTSEPRREKTRFGVSDQV